MTERIFVLDETDFHLQLEEADAGLSSTKAAADGVSGRAKGGGQPGEDGPLDSPPPSALRRSWRCREFQLHGSPSKQMSY
jgi:hypothetical protein